MKIDLSEANSLPDRSNELFRIFARFEFALKVTGFAVQNGDRAQILWDQFANSQNLGQDFFDTVRRKNLCSALFDDPPKRQVLVGDQLKFDDDAAAPKNAQELFVLARRVRNNLFHGGKFIDTDEQRDAVLVRQTIDLLKFALERDLEVRWAFEGKV